MALFHEPKRVYLENKHLSSEHSHCVKVPFTDVWSIVIWSIGGPRAVGVPGRWLRWPWLWAAGSHSGQGLSWTTVRLT